MAGAGPLKDGQQWLQRINGMRQWKRGNQRAPHKPLLLLYALSRLQNDRTSRMRYEDCESRLEELLRDFGPPRKSHHPNYPFIRLANDRLWKVTDRNGTQLVTANITTTQISSKRLVDIGIVGQLDPADEKTLLANPQLLYTTVRKLLIDNWPSSLHAEICDRLGLTLGEIENGLTHLRLDVEQIGDPTVPLDGGSTGNDSSSDAADLSQSGKRRQRDPDFRERVLRTYEYRCAMCGWDGRMDNITVGLEAAHLQWHAHNGPDNPQNGLSLCVLHHKLLDRGVLGLTNDRRISVSQHFFARGPTAEAITDLAGQQIRSPQVARHHLDPKHIKWHQDEVFRPPARELQEQ